MFMPRIISIVGLIVTTSLLAACGGNSFKAMEKNLYGVVSTSGDRLVGVVQKWQGACDTTDPWHPVAYCGEYDNSGYVKDHSFQLWTSGSDLPLSYQSEWMNTEEMGGQYSQVIAGEVFNVRYVHNSAHHYVLVSVRIIDFVETDATITSGEFVVYKVALGNNGAVTSVTDVVRNPVNCNIEASNGFYGSASKDGSVISVIETGDCAANHTISFYDATNLSVLHTQTFEATAASGPAHFPHPSIRLEGSWVTVTEGADDAALWNVYANPLKSWNNNQSWDANSVANPAYRAAVVDYIEALEVVDRAALTTEVFLTGLQGNEPALQQIRFLDDGSVEASAFASQGEGNFSEATSNWDSEGLTAYIVDYGTKMLRTREFLFAYGNDHLSERFELTGNRRNANMGYVTDANTNLEFSSSTVSAGVAYTPEFQPVEGQITRRTFNITESETDRSYLLELNCISMATDVSEHSSSSEETCASSWGGLPDSESGNSFARFAWTFSADHSLYTCLSYSSSLNDARNTSVSAANLATGCNGSAWREMKTQQ